jgi:hypothetical protein
MSSFEESFRKAMRAASRSQHIIRQNDPYDPRATVRETTDNWGTFEGYPTRTSSGWIALYRIRPRFGTKGRGRKFRWYTTDGKAPVGEIFTGMEAALRRAPPSHFEEGLR